MRTFIAQKKKNADAGLMGFAYPVTGERSSSSSSKRRIACQR
jgi:hypothetical protein